MEGSINTKINRGKGGTYYIAARIDTQDPVSLQKFNELMGALGYRAFPAKSKNPAWTKQVIPTNVDEVESEISRVATDMGIVPDLSGLETIKGDFTSLQQPQQPQQSQSGSEATDTIESFVDKLKREMQTTSTDEQAKMMTDMIAQQLETLATSVDEAKKQDFIKNFFDFASQFWNYSFSNQMLIFFQSQGKAQYVKGRKQWQELGRKVRADANAIAILAPTGGSSNVDATGLDMVLNYVSFYLRSFPNESDLRLSNNIRKFLGIAKTRIPGRRYSYLLNLFNSKRFLNVRDIESYLKSKASSGNGDSAKSFMKFKAVQVFDYSDTDPLPGHEGKIFEPPSKDVWMSKYNTEDAKAESVRDSLLEFAQAKGIEIDLTKDTGTAGGWSGGKNIAISYESKGQRQLSTIIHEIAHELLHWGEDRATMNKKEKEIDAESVAYIVMRHFGFEADYAPNYLALHGADSKEVKGRRESITKAVKEILTAIHARLLGSSNKESKSHNWYKRANRKPYTFEDLFIPVIYIGF